MNKKIAIILFNWNDGKQYTVDNSDNNYIYVRIKINSNN